MYSPITLEVNLDNICTNYKYLSFIANAELACIKTDQRQKNSNLTVTHETVNELYLTASTNNLTFTKEVSAVVKSDAYGLGAEKISDKLYSQGCTKFFVANLNEAIILRQNLPNAATIFVLHGIMEGEEEIFFQYNLQPVINHLDQYRIWNNYAYNIQKKLPCVLHVDTGMNRLGMPEEEVNLLIQSLKTEQYVKFSYIMSHLACADEIDNEFNSIQLRKFKEFLKFFPGIKASLVNSSGMFLGAEYHFDMLRPGMALYGLNPHSYLSNPMKPVLSLNTKIIQIKKITKEASIGYGCAEILKAGTIVATIPIGYADGYKRMLSQKGIVYINNFPAKILGRVSMDLVTIDISHIPPQLHQIGQKVEIFGNNISVDSLAKDCGIFNYEFLTSLGKNSKNYISST